MKCYLRNLHDGKKHYLSPYKTNIGKGNCDINLKSHAVSEEHALVEFDFEQQAFILKDLQTSHGTYVNEKRILNRTALTHGDVIKLGHGGPRLEVYYESVVPNPPVVNQRVWNNNTRDLPYLPPNNNGNNGSYTDRDINYSSIIPQPPSSGRPQTAYPLTNGRFNKTTPRPHSSLIAYSQNSNDTLKELDRELETFNQNLQADTNASLETVNHESMVEALREDVAALRREKLGLTQTYQKRLPHSKYIQQLASLQQQITDRDDRNKKLITEIEKLKSGLCEQSTTQLQEMKTMAMQQHHQITTLQKKVSEQEQIIEQLNSVVQTHKREIEAKESAANKTKNTLDKQRVLLRNKDVEINSLQMKVTNQSRIADLENELKNKDAEITSLRNRLSTTTHKNKEKDLSIKHYQQNLLDVKQSSTQLEKKETLLYDDLRMLRSEYSKLERSEQQTKQQLDDVHNKYNLLFDRLVKMAGEDGRTFRSMIDDDGVYSFIREMKDERDDAVQSLENLLDEKATLERSYSLEHNEYLKTALQNMTKRLMEDGYSCKNLMAERDRLQDLVVPDKLNWFKDFVISMLTQHYLWENEIENALKTIKGDEDDQFTNPSMHIRDLKFKMADNMKNIIELEENYDQRLRWKRRINDAEARHSSTYDDVKSKVKSKYKEKQEKIERDVKLKYEEKLEKERDRWREEEAERLAVALKEQRDALERKRKDMNVLSEKIHQLKDEHRHAREEFVNLQSELKQSRKNESQLKDSLKDLEKALERQESDIIELYRSKYQDKLDNLKCENNDKEGKIRDLEDKLTEKRHLESIYQDIKDENKEKKNEIKRLQEEYERKIDSLKEQLQDLMHENKHLKSELETSQRDFSEQKEITKTLSKDLQGVSARLTDLRGELSEEQKVKVENLEENVARQERQLKEKSNQLLKMCEVVEEQKKKLMEQDNQIIKQNSVLAKQADQLVNKPPHATVSDKMRQSSIVETCLGDCHEEVIRRQKETISDLRSTIKTFKQLHPHEPSRAKTMKHLSKLQDEKQLLKTHILLREDWDQEFIAEARRSKELLEVASTEFEQERLQHKETQETLHACDSIFVNFTRFACTELDINDDGEASQPIGFVSSEQRQQIIEHRNQLVELIKDRVKILVSRLERKDSLLQNYDHNLRNLREKEESVNMKTAEAIDLERQLHQSRSEVSYLQEALRKCRSQLDDQKRLIQKLKLNKDLNIESHEYKIHSCYADTVTKTKDDKIKEMTRKKNKEILIKKKDSEIDNLKKKLKNNEIRLKQANEQLKQYTSPYMESEGPRDKVVNDSISMDNTQPSSTPLQQQVDNDDDDEAPLIVEVD